MEAKNQETKIVRKIGYHCGYTKPTGKADPPDNIKKQEKAPAIFQFQWAKNTELWVECNRFPLSFLQKTISLPNDLSFKKLTVCQCKNKIYNNRVKPKLMFHYWAKEYQEIETAVLLGCT